ncbi:cyclic nucleotide-binding domain-containing protein [Rhodocytophaga rosea]|uniref:Cyclic nucleotide-binding domain-containing protein n=1 Tax=Rhodocytophaga rosea TaxID=2704465 RepID=A0A6C0GQ97_9BACT|nr:cyclic nucleotide-binding domain-containing protein [Rhodocytophaga rosea]QHT69752.1 cyclic nucleotide-binding domain-containing protein [Rhodocytophaga rosea]
MKYSEKIKDLLNLQKGEGPTVLRLMLYSFFQTVALALFFTTASAVFLTQYPITTLPYVYITGGLLFLFINEVYSRLANVYPAQRLILAEIIVFFLCVLLFRFGLAYAQVGWLVFCLIVWHRIMSAYIGTGFIRLNLILFNVRQSKRLLGLVSSMEVPGNVLGYLLASVMIPVIGTINLLWLSAVALLLAMVFLISIIANKKAFDLEEPETQKTLSIKPKGIVQRFFKTNFIYALSVTCSFAVLTFIFIEFAFLSQVNEQFSSQAEIAYFISIIMGTGQLIAFFIKISLYGYIQRRYGIQVALFALPFALGIITIFSLISSSFSGNTFLLAWFWVVIMLVNDTIKAALYSNTFISLLQPLQTKLKMFGLDTLGVIEAIAVSVAGVALVGFGWLSSLTLVHFSVLLLMVLVGWVASISYLNKSYIHTLEVALKKRILEGSSLKLESPDVLAMIQAKLNSPFPGEVLYALDILCKSKSGKAPELLLQLMAHPSAEVRMEVLKKIESLKLVSLQGHVKERIESEPDLIIKKHAIRLYCFLGEETVVEEISPYLDSKEKLIQTGALVGLICFGGISGVILAGQHLNEYVFSEDPEKRAFAAGVIGEVGIQHFYHPLLKLMEDEDVVVRKAALKAAGKIKHPRLYGSMLRAVSSPQVFEVAMNALISTGEEVTGLFETEFNKPDYNPVWLRRLIYVCGKVGGNKSIALLKDKLYFKNIEVRNQILHSLTLCRYQPSPSEKDKVLTSIQAELTDAGWFLNCIEVITLSATPAELPHYSLLISALHIELLHLKKRLVLLLSYIYNSNDVLQVWESMHLSNKEKKANAFEVLDVLIAKDLSSIILPLLEDFPISQQVKIFNTRFPQKRLSLHVYLQKLISRQEVPVVNIWTQAISLYVVRQLSIHEMSNEAILAVSHPNKLVAETALWVLKDFYPDTYTNYLSSLAFEDIHLLQETTHEKNKQVMNSQLLDIEKVMALKTTTIFRETSEDILVDVASILKEVPVQAGESIVKKDDMGTCMFIIYSGSVRVHDGEHTLAELKTRDFFGELSLLDTEPRSASVTALVDTFLLRLDQHAFYEIMADRIEVTREIMKILCRRLRHQNKIVAEMKERITNPVLKAN